MTEHIDKSSGAVLALDIVGFSALMGADETGTLQSVKRLFDTVLRPTIASHGGRVFKTMGDGALAEFSDGTQAVRCGLDIQAQTGASATPAPSSDLHLRIGVNLGDLLYLESDVFGDTVNVAARLEGMAAPGGVLISDAVYVVLPSDLASAFFDNGHRKFKNIARQTRVWSWPAELPSPRSEGKPRVYVAPFQSQDETGTDEIFAEEIHRHLGRLTGLQTVKTRDEAHYLLSGSIRVAKARCRVTAQVTDLGSDSQIRAERFDAQTDDAFDIADLIAPGVVMNLRRQVASHDAERLRDRPLDELSKDDLMALAGVSFFNPSFEGWHGAGVLSEQALEIDPQAFMALAMAAAGLGLADPLYTARATPEPVLSLALERIETAIRLNSRSDMVHTVRGGLLLYGYQRFSDAEAAIRQALVVNEQYNMGWWMLGAVQTFSGDFDKGLQSATRAVEIEPNDPFVHLYCRVAGYASHCLGAYSDALDWFQRADQVAPGLLPNLVAMAACQSELGDQAAARVTIETLLKTNPDARCGTLHPLPFKDPGIWAKLLSSVQTAGLPE